MPKDDNNNENKKTNATFLQIAAEASVGHLGIITPDGYPRVVPVNFVAVGETIYFHGAIRGEKFLAFHDRPKVTLSIDIPYALVPSYWRSEKYACPATQYFKSALVKGRGVIVEDADEKARALQALMEKHQPEGGYETIDPAVPHYAKALEHVGVYRVRCDSWSGKIKFGQDEPEKLQRTFIEKLRERGGPMDEATALEIEHFPAG